MPRYKTARCVLYRPRPGANSNNPCYEFLLAIHSSFWAKKIQRWGLPGGRIEWREDPVDAVLRELQEELDITLSKHYELGDYRYKRALHKVICAPWERDIDSFDKQELLEVRWFSQDQISELSQSGLLHAGYELDAVTRLRQKLTLTGSGSTASESLP